MITHVDLHDSAVRVFNQVTRALRRAVEDYRPVADIHTAQRSRKVA
jgi:hypothetical protein